MKVEQLMSKGAVTCRADSSLNEAASLMWEFDLGFLPVVDSNDRLIGTITDRDICMAAFTQGVALANSPVSSAMARRVHTCRASDSILHAEELMAKNQLRRLPITDGGGSPIGVLSVSDLASRAAGDSKGNGVSADEVSRTLRAVTKPRKKSGERPHAGAEAAS